MKEKVKNYLFCLCALAMCLMFALAVFFKSCNSVKAAINVPSDVICSSETPNSVLYCGDITYNTGQTLGATISNGSFIGHLMYNGSSFKFTYYSISNANPTFTLSDCVVSSSTTSSAILNCNLGSYQGYYSITSTSLPSYTDTLLTITRGNASTNYYDTLVVDSFRYGTSSTNIVNNVTFMSKGLSYSDGYNRGYSDSRLNVINDLYYYACLQYPNNVVCPSSKYTRSELIQLTNQDIIVDILTIGGNGGALPVALYDYLKSKSQTIYESCILYSDSCVTWTSTDLTLSNLSNGLEYILTNQQLLADSSSYDNGYTVGRSDGLQAGIEEGKQLGYSEGFFDGQNSEDIIGNAVLSVASTPLMILSGMLNFDIFGFNVLGLVLGLFTFVLVIWVLKKVF